MITINQSPDENCVLLDANNTLISITSDNGLGYYFRVFISINDMLFDEQSWSRKDDFTAEKDLKKLYNAYFETIFNPNFTNGLNIQNHLKKKVSILIQEYKIEDGTMVQDLKFPDYFIIYNVKPVYFNDEIPIQFLGIDPDILQIPFTGKISIPFMFNVSKGKVIVELFDNNDNLIDQQIIPEAISKTAFLYSFDIATVANILPRNILYLKLRITPESTGTSLEKIFRLMQFPKYKIKEIAFLNNFGYWIYAYLDGQLAIDNNLDINQYQELDGTDKIFEINEKQNYTINTGPLLGSEKAIANQIVNALEAKILLNNEYISMINATKKISIYKDNNNLYSDNLVFSVKKNNSVSNILLLRNQIEIIAISQISNTNCELVFTSNYDLTQLFVILSLDGITWSDPIVLVDVSSPQVANLDFSGFQFVRIFDNIQPPVYSNIFTWAIPALQCPIPTGLSYTVVETDYNGNPGYQQFKFSWDNLDVVWDNIITEMFIGITDLATGSVSGENVSKNSPLYTLLPLGKYNFYFYYLGTCEGSQPNDAFTNIGIVSGPSITPSASTSCSGNNNNSPAPGCSGNGSLVIANGSYKVRARASIYTGNNCSVNVDIVVNGVNMTASNTNGQGQDHYSSNYVILTAGAYTYSYSTSFSGTNGSADGGLSWQIQP